jgi:hypothetical protein
MDSEPSERMVHLAEVWYQTTWLPRAASGAVGRLGDVLNAMGVERPPWAFYNPSHGARS